MIPVIMNPHELVEVEENMKLREKKGMSRDSRRNRKLFSFTLVFMFILTSFTVMIIIMPSTVEAGGEAPPGPSPRQDTLYCDTDTRLDEANSGSNYGTDDELRVDPYYGLVIHARDRSLIQFDLDFLDGCYIVSADLKIRYLGSIGQNPSGRYHACWELGESWTESTATWDKRNSGSYWGDDGVSGYGGYYRDINGGGVDNSDIIDDAVCPSSASWVTFDVKSSVENFADGTRENYGWLIDDKNEGTSLSYTARYYSSDETSPSEYRPQLVVAYIEKPSCQTNDVQAGDVGETSATLRGQVIDDGGDYCNYQFSYYRQFFLPSTTSWSAGTVYGSGTFSQSASSLSRGVRYYYQAKLKNDAGAGSLGSPEKSFLTAPGQITGFTATPFGIGQINLTWNNGAASTGIDGAYIEYRITEPGGLEGEWIPGAQTKIDADGYVAGTSFIHDDLERNKSYWYKAWPYAEDDSEKSDGSSTKPYGTSTSVVDTSTEDFPDQWFLVDSSNLHSCCEGESPYLEGALDGSDTWECSEYEEYWFILDLGTNYTVGAVRGRSNYDGYDPISVDIYVARTIEDLNNEESKLTKEGSITDWQNTQTWVTHDPEEDLDGRYVKVLIAGQEVGQEELKFGQTDMLQPFSIFDLYVSNCLPEMRCSVNNSSPDAGSPITFDASESFDQGGSIVNYKWDFDGDGQTDSESETAAVNHEYSFASVYTAVITAEDDLGSTNSTTEQVTVKQKISLVKNSENDGINYITWGATASIQADELAGESYADLQNNDVIQMFDETSGNWSIIYIYPGGPDFTINRWDHIRIHCTNEKTFSVTPDGSVDSSQNKTLTYSVDNHGYHYYTWSNDFSIKASVFTTNSKLDLTNQPISVYNPTTGKWKGYTEIPGLPQVIKDNMDFYINSYDVICFKVASGTENAYYDASNY